MTPDHRLTVNGITVEIGRLTHDELRQALKDQSISMNAMGGQLFDLMPLLPGEGTVTIQFVERTVEQLGFPNGAMIADIIAAARSLGLDVCPLEAAAYLRLAYQDQPIGDRITVASAPPAETEERPNGFYLQRREDGLWLRGYTASSDWVFSKADRFCFLRLAFTATERLRHHS